MAITAEDWAILLGGADGAIEGGDVLGAINELTFMSEGDSSDVRYPEIQLVVIRRNKQCWDYPLSKGEKKERTILLYEKELGANQHVIERLTDRTDRHRSERRELRDHVSRSKDQVSALKEENQRIVTTQLRERTQVGSEHEVAALKATSRLLQERAEEAHHRLQSTQLQLKACIAERAKRETRNRGQRAALRRRMRNVRFQMAKQRRKALAKKRHVHVKKMQNVLTKLADSEGKRAKQEAHLSWLKEKSDSERQLLKRLAYMMHEFIRNWEKLARFLRERDAARVEEAVQTQSALIQEAEVSLSEFDVPPPPARLPVGPGDEADGATAMIHAGKPESTPGEAQQQQQQVQHGFSAPRADVVRDTEEYKPSTTGKGKLLDAYQVDSVRKMESCESLASAAMKHHSWSWTPPAPGASCTSLCHQRPSRVETVPAGSARSSTCVASTGPYSARSSSCTYSSTWSGNRSGSLEPLDKAMVGMQLKVTPRAPMAWHGEHALPEPLQEAPVKRQPATNITPSSFRCVHVQPDVQPQHRPGTETPPACVQRTHQPGAETPQAKYQLGADTPRGLRQPWLQTGADTPRTCQPPPHLLAGLPSPCRAPVARAVVSGFASVRHPPVHGGASGTAARPAPDVVQAIASGPNSNTKTTSSLSTALISPRFARAAPSQVAGASATAPVRILQQPL